MLIEICCNVLDKRVVHSIATIEPPYKNINISTTEPCLLFEMNPRCSLRFRLWHPTKISASEKLRGSIQYRQ